MDVHPRLLAVGAVVLGLLAAGCGETGSRTPSPPTLDLPFETRALAVALGSDPRFRGFGPFDPNLIGQDRWYEVLPLGDGVRVRLHVGWGDCPAGCINKHEIDIDLARSLAIVAVTERGDPLPPGLLPGDEPTAPASLLVSALAGPTCPAERPGDPACAPRPVAATIELLAPDGSGVAAARTAADGTATVEVPAGVYLVFGRADEAFMTGDPAPVVVSLAGGRLVSASLLWDTGIR